MSFGGGNIFGEFLDFARRYNQDKQISLALPSTGNEAADTLMNFVQSVVDDKVGPSLKRPPIKGEQQPGTSKVMKMQVDEPTDALSAQSTSRTGTTTSGNSLPTTGSMRCYSTMHISRFRLPYRGVISIPECDVYKTRQQFDYQDRVFLLDTFTMAPFIYCRSNNGNGFETYNIADIILSHFDMWRPKRVSYTLSHFKSTTTRLAQAGGTNKNISYGNPEGRICIATDSLSQIMDLRFSNERAGMTIDQFVAKSVYECGADLPANNFGNPLYFSDVKWLNEQSEWTYTYDFNDIFMGKYWIERVEQNGYTLNNWSTLNIPLIPGNNTSGNLSNNTSYKGVASDLFDFPNQRNQNSPVMLFCPRTGEYTEDETEPRLSATCVVDAYMDFECAMFPWRQTSGLNSGYQTHTTQFFLNYEIPRRNNNTVPFPEYTHWFFNLPPVVK